MSPDPISGFAGGSGRHTQVEASIKLELGDVSVVTEHWAGTIDTMGVNAFHHLQLSLFASNLDAAACYTDHWVPHRFERIGALFLIPANHAIHARSDCRNQRSIVCRMDTDAVSNWFGNGIVWTDRRLTESLDISSTNIRSLMCRISDEMRNPAFANEQMINLKIAEIGIELSRHFMAVEEGAAVGGLAPWRLRRIDAYLAQNAAGATLKGLAHLCNLSERHLARAFRVSRGCSLGDHIASQRVELARRLLGEGVSVKETAFALGFAFPGNFSASFQRFTGETPRKYQERTSRSVDR